MGEREFEVADIYQEPERINCWMYLYDLFFMYTSYQKYPKICVSGHFIRFIKISEIYEIQRRIHNFLTQEQGDH